MTKSPNQNKQYCIVMISATYVTHLSTYPQDLQQSAAPQPPLQHQSRLRLDLCRVHAATKSPSEVTQQSALPWPANPQFYCHHKASISLLCPQLVQVNCKIVLKNIPFFQLDEEIIHKGLHVRHDYH